ncbi:MAG: AsmA family protein [Hyphomonadaceae bacterium]|nr:AsmA family protein [Hyphomonadaceae bacterium]
MRGMWKWLLTIVGVVVGLIVVAAAALYFFFPKQAVRAEIERQVEHATKRDVTIRSVDVAFWPALGLAANGVSLSNPQGFGATPFLSADRIVFAVALIPLLSGDIEIKRLILEKPVLTLAVKEDGKDNWTFPQPEGEQKPMQDFSIDEFRVSDGAFSFQGKDGEPLAVGDIDLRVTLASLDQPSQIEGAFDYRGRRIEVESRLGLPRALLEAGQTPLTARIKTPNFASTFNGAWNAETGALEGRIEADGQSLRDTLAWVGAPLGEGPGFLAYSVRAQMMARGSYESGSHENVPTTIALTQGAFGLDAVRAQGDVTVTMPEGGRMKAAGRLTIPELDLNTYMPPPPQGAQAGGVNAQTAWSTDPLDLGGLKAADADLNLTLARLKFQRMQFADAQLALRIDNGVANAHLARMSLYGGSGTARLIANANGNRIRSEIDFQNIQAEPLLTDAIGLNKIAGRGRLQATLEGAGASQAALMRSLGGTAAFTFNDGQWKGVNLAQIARTIQSTISGTARGAAAATDFAELSSTFRVANGAAVTQDLKLLNPYVRLDGQGIIDIGQQTIDMRIAPRAVNTMEGQGGQANIAGLGVPFRIAGPWTRVQFSLALGDVVQNQLRQQMNNVLSGQTKGGMLGQIGAALGGRQQQQPATTEGEQPQQQQQQQQPRMPDLGSLFNRPKQN